MHSRPLLAAAALAGAIESSLAAGITWGPCEGELAAVTNMQCGTLSVPMDYSDPSCANITLGMARIAANSSKPLGNLMVNPGGPGGSAVAMVAGQALGEPFFSQDLLNNYNIIGTDPRGVGLSNPITCNADVYNQAPTHYITTEAEFDELMTWNKAFGKSCSAMTGLSLQFMDTISAAKDLDQIRQALGDDKLNYFGFSYGSQLGYQYAELFPQHVGRMILDGILDHTQNSTTSLLDEVMGFESTLVQFFDWCNTTTDCAFYGQDLPSIFDKMVDEANVNPIPAPNCPTIAEANPIQNIIPCKTSVTGYELISGVQEGITFPNGSATVGSWAVLSENLLLASQGNATALSTALVANSVSSIFEDQFPELAIGCQDWNSARSAHDLIDRLAEARAVAPHTRGVSQTLQIQAQCAAWPVRVRNPPKRLNQRALARAPPIMIVSSFYDPETSIAEARSIRAQMPTSFIIFRNGSGHSSYVDFGATSAAEDAFLISGTKPADEAVFQS